MAKRPSGLIKRGEIYWIEKRIKGRRIRESTGTGDLYEAEKYLNFRLNEIRIAEIYGHRPERDFEQAAARYLVENQSIRSIMRTDQSLRLVMHFVGNVELSRFHYGSLQPFIEHRQRAGMKPATINRDLAAVRQVLKAATRWFHPDGQPWLNAVPELPRLKVPQNCMSSRAITWAEQAAMVKALPEYLAEMTLFALNTGMRRGEVLSLRWSWLLEDQPGFMIPAAFHKTGDQTGDRLVVCNSVAMSVIEAQKGKHPESLFSINGKPVRTFYGRAWRKAREEAGLPTLRVHDLRHTYATRLRAAGVSEDDRADLLGHSNGRITRHYSAPDVQRLVNQAEKIVEMKREPVLRAIKQSPQSAHSG